MTIDTVVVTEGVETPAEPAPIVIETPTEAEIEAQTEGTVAIIEAEGAADVARIEAEGEAAAAVIEAAAPADEVQQQVAELTEWQKGVETQIAEQDSLLRQILERLPPATETMPPSETQETLPPAPVEAGADQVPGENPVENLASEAETGATRGLRRLRVIR